MLEHKKTTPKTFTPFDCVSTMNIEDVMKGALKILLFDIETAPNLGYIWGKWEQDVIENTRDWYMLSFAYKWLGEKTQVYSLPDFKGYKKNPEDDSKLIQRLWELLNEADVVIAHNGDRFDLKKANARFIQHGLTPPKPYKTVDTYKVARKYFRFDSNKLDDLGQYLKVGKKLPTGGFATWKGCMAGEMKSWKLMTKYNIQDVDLLEKVFLKLRPWITNFPAVRDGCPNCGGERIKRGFLLTKRGPKQRFQCKECGAWSQ